MQVAHKIRLVPTEEQITAFKKACGCARFAYNWALAEWNRQYEAGGKPNGDKLNKEFNKLKATELLWLYDSPKAASQQPFDYLQKSFERFFKKISDRPKFKKRGQKDSFYIDNSCLTLKHFTDKSVKLPKIGVVKVRQKLRYTGKLKSATVKRVADQWYLIVQMEVSQPFRKVKLTDKKVGLDLGLKTTIVTSDGQRFNSPKPLRKFEKKLKKLQRSLSRKVKGSNNREKAKVKLSRLHNRIANIRNDWSHKVTTKLIDENQVICLENLNVSGMLKNHKLAKSISDVSWSEIRRQLEYKANWYGREVRFVDRFYPSSKTCSKCGCVKESLSLKERVFSCNDCGNVLDRDINAAINIRDGAVKIVNTAGSAGINAWGDEQAVSYVDEPRTNDLNPKDFNL